MRNMNPALSPQRLAALCGPAARDIAIEVVAETGSTNADLLAGLENLHGPALLLAETQTAGRGRAGRPWHSAPGAALTFSLAWKFRRPVHALVGLPLAVGVVIAEVLSTFSVDARLKWPNDVLKDGDKLAGILIETAKAQTAPEDAVWAIIGVGINIAIGDGLAARIGRPVADVRSLSPDREQLMAALLTGLAQALPLFERDGFKPFAARWNDLHAYAGQAVIIMDGGRVLHEGVAAGVDDSGRLLLDSAGGRIAVVAGDVSLRIKEG
jgi:BirA family biotin operon repressor/biotin-[acetyl-CoA-carboxylase] ligase